MDSKKMIEGFIERFYNNIEFDNHYHKGSKIPKSEIIRKKDKKTINRSLDEIANSIISANTELKGRESRRFFNIVTDFFIKDCCKYKGEFYYGADIDLLGIAENMVSQKASLASFMDNAVKSGNSLQYAKAFSRAETIENSLMLHKVIKGRNQITLIKKFDVPNKDEIEKTVYDCLKNAEGSIQNLSQLVKVPEYYSLKNLPFAGPCGKLFSMMDSDKDFLARYGFMVLVRHPHSTSFVANIESEYRINGSLQVYVINKPEHENQAGFYDIPEKKIFVIKDGGFVGKFGPISIIKHETEHFINDNLGFNLNPVDAEYMAFLAQIKFSYSDEDMMQKLNHLFNRNYRSEHHQKAVSKLRSDIKFEMNMRNMMCGNAKMGKEYVKSIRMTLDSLYDSVYVRKLGMTYDMLEKLCK